MIEKSIKFASTISDGTEQLVHDFVVPGMVYFNEDGSVSRVDFAEPIENDLTLETSIIVEADRLKIVREGQVSMAQSFVLHEDVDGTYETEYGTLETRVYTTALEVTGDEHTGEIYVAYDFYFDNERASTISLVIEYE